MRVAAQEGIGGAPHDVVAPRSSASSPAGGFFALLAVLQNGGETTGAASSDATAVVDGDDTSGDEGSDDAAAQALLATEGVVVTLSTATATTAADPAAAATGAATDATATGSSGGTAGEVVKLLDGSASAATGATAPDAAAAAGMAAESAAVATSSNAVAGEDSSAAAGAAPGEARTLPASAPAGRGVGANAAARSTRGTTAEGTAGRGQTAQSQQATPASASPPAASSASSAATAAADAAAAGEHDVARVIGSDAGRHATPRVETRARRHPDESEDGASEDMASADDAGFAPGRPAGTPGATRELPAGTRLLAEPLQAHGQAHGQHGADATARADAFGVARSEGTTGSTAGDGTTRLRAAGFTSGDATLPSWVERLASSDGLAATRRGTLHLDLEPNGLGRIEVRLSYGRDGVRASVLAEHEHTRTLLASQQPQLAAALERSDLRLESFFVDVGTQSGGDGREAFRDATDPAAFEQIGLVHVSEPDTTSDTTMLPSVAARGLVNVRA